MFSDALNAPARTPDAVSTVFLGGVLVFVSTVGPLLLLVGVATTPLAFAFAPFVAVAPLVLRGYYVGAVRTGIRGDPATPSFVRWGDLVADGGKSLLLSLGYLLPVGLLAGLAGGVAYASESGRLDALPGADPAVSALIVLTGLLCASYLLCYVYVRPAALSILVATGRLRAAFAPRTVLRVARDDDYAAGWFVGSLVLVVGLAFALPLELFVVGFPLAFYVRSAAHATYGRAASTAVDLDRPAADSTASDSDASTADASTLDPAIPPEVPPEIQTGRTIDARRRARGRPTVRGTPDGGRDLDDGGTPADETDPEAVAADGFVWGGAEDPTE
ncbi:DUF4013 domain-containing protein [Halegenticoccus tardaugens]|uniref:DUF4013 domain-containing protein n=1 Tax=Halegenticoccus tardaugens TaxID=2071624 RepID=UPI0013E938E0|nr:DUF4013 domain-containing protein [Halegenticoccus tardaugens]